MAVNSATNPKLDEILIKATKEIPLNQDELLSLLRVSDEKELTQVFEAARLLRTRYFLNKVFSYGFVYFSTYCRNECAFCFYRKSNKSLQRYRKTDLEIMKTAFSLIDSGVHLIDLTMGEDSYFFQNQGSGFAHMIRTVEMIKKSTSIPIMLSAGVLPEDVLSEFKEAGVDWYATYQETHNPKLYSRLRLGQSYDERMNRKTDAQKMGFLLEEGLLTGVGDTDEDLVNSFEEMKKLGADQLRVMSFIPQKDTPMQHFSAVPRARELLVIAIMRLVFPDRLIPASLDVDGLNGLAERLNAGANVVTSIIPPESGLAGVSNHSLDIEDGNRTISKITPILEKCGLVMASRQDYKDWILMRQNKFSISRKEACACE
ncbi:methylornithine synthase PylB [Desulfosporosinus nitroreducens]|uniref:methylornithine synthase PylB n=1 Tax=Desulfosporosinus nitroreducens TaxID=2018668 RepID=UPI00207CF58D|nr:methylornithine synthase PylB [Desulfosporosinus nitroreducens]MCO1604291.1 methylornithine synthase PylB [Desulfosporosinus nitroreducens]